ncbi:Cox19 protein [Maudiozyma humilis]|uniref:Cox19 protein n=1 Tax=Maudiozyma humilis TaxID=51915 RepID=A0AAV5S3H8_MAUHU|nr:Cox19 protein [Kazachstania humilis]
MSGNPGNALSRLSPTPPERGSFPLDHDGECVTQMAKYLACMKLVQNENAPNCRLLAKEYLRCRMDHRLMDRDEWSHLGLPGDPQGYADPAAPNAPGKHFGQPDAAPKK